MNKAETFRLSRRWRIAFFAVALGPTLVMIAMAVSQSTPLAVPIRSFGNAIVTGILMWLFATGVLSITVTRDGVTLYRIWKVRWEDVTSARRRDSLGLPYLKVVRAGRWPATLALPLYLVGGRPLVAALCALAPSNNPIRQHLEASQDVAPIPRR
jgi:hypothetical protein